MQGVSEGQRRRGWKRRDAAGSCEMKATGRSEHREVVDQRKRRGWDPCGEAARENGAAGAARGNALQQRAIRAKNDTARNAT